MADPFGFPVPPRFIPDGERHRQLLGEAVQGAFLGKTNNVIVATLTANAVSTTITDARITAGSWLGFMPETANAAAELGNGTLYVADSGRVNGSATITHANNAQTDRTFRIAIIG